MDFKNGAIAIATDDGTMVSSHFGRARFYEIINLSNGKVIKRERREKAGHHSFAPVESDQNHHSDEASEHRHQTMVSPVLDCQAVIVGGMGQGAVEHLRRSKLIPILTDLHTIEEVIEAIAAGTLSSDPRRIHQHHGQH